MPRNSSRVRVLALAPDTTLRLRLLVLLFGAALLLSITACGGKDDSDAPSLSQPDATGQTLTNTYITLLQKKDVPGLTAFLSDAFMIQRADGSFATKADYLTNIPDIGNYTISNVAAKQTGEALVVRWQLEVDEVIDGKVFKPTPAPRLSTFVWTDGSWRLLSHANFNAPVPTGTAAGPQ